MPPYLLAQLSDPHIGADWSGEGLDPAATLERTLDAIRALDVQPQAVLVSGDLAEHATLEEYARARSLLERIGAPIHVLPGNHDDRAALRTAFAVEGEADAPVHYAADLGPLRLVVLDSTRPGEEGGELDRKRLDALDATLADAPGRPTLLALHHPPVLTGFPVFDRIGLPAGDRAALAALLERHAQVRLIVCGHVHRTIAGELAGRPVLAAPSTYMQAAPEFAGDRIALTREPPGFALHAVLDGRLASSVCSA